MNIDVLIPTMRGLNKHSLDQLKLDIDKSHIIVSDERNKNRSLTLARMSLIKLASTEFFFFLDDDINYNSGLISYLSQYIDDDVGAIQGVTFPQGLGIKLDKSLRDYILQISPSVEVVKNNGFHRLYTHNTLIRTDLVKDWIDKDEVAGFEDLSIQRHIQKKGFKCLKVLTPFQTLHKFSWLKIFYNALWNGRGYYNLMGLKFFIKRIIKLSTGLIKHFLLLPLNPRLNFYRCYMNYCCILGSLLFIFGYRSKWKSDLEVMKNGD